MKRYISIGLILFTIASLFMNWVRIEELDAGGPLAQKEIAQMEQQGFSQQEIHVMNAISQSGGFSPYSLMRAFSIFARHELLEDEETQFLIKGFEVIIQIYFWGLIVLLFKLCVQHVFGRKAKGIGTWLLLLPVFALCYVLHAAEEALLTPIPFIAVCGMLVSCLLWSAHIKEAGAKTGGYTLRKQDICQHCGAKQTESVNMFCESCHQPLNF